MLAFVFPGQGSQQPAMGAGFVDHPSWELVARASDAAGRDVAHLLLEADADELRETRNAQLGTFVHSMVVLDAARALGLEATVAAGHSLGEYSALCAAGVLDFDDAVRLVTERGEAMQVAATSRRGTMAAVLGLADDAVADACAATGAEVWVANHNAPGQVVIAGDPGAIDAAATEVKGRGAKRVMPLEVAGAFHTPFMAPAAERLRAALSAATFRPGVATVVANVDAAPHPEPKDWPDLLARQLTSPVRWTQSVERLVADGVTAIVELGPGAVLAGTVKRIDASLARASAMTPDEIDAASAALAEHAS